MYGHGHDHGSLLNEEAVAALKRIEERYKRVKRYDEVIGDAMRVLWDTTLAEYAKIIAAATPEQARVIKVAKAICIANGYSDPDLVVMGQANVPAMIGAKGTVVVEVPLQPQWAVFYQDALAAIEVVDSVEEGSK